MFEGGQISEGGDKFPRKFGPGGTNFWGDIFPVTPGRSRIGHSSIIYNRCYTLLG